MRIISRARRDDPDFGVWCRRNGIFHILDEFSTTSEARAPADKHLHRYGVFRCVQIRHLEGDREKNPLFPESIWATITLKSVRIKAQILTSIWSVAFIMSMVKAGVRRVCLFNLPSPSSTLEETMNVVRECSDFVYRPASEFPQCMKA